VDYIKRYMGAPTGIDVEALKAECEQLRKDKAELEATVKSLNEQVRRSVRSGGVREGAQHSIGQHRTA
jgi:hypothetical protein